MWDDVELTRNPDRSLPRHVRDALLAKTEDEANRLVAHILETEVLAVLQARDERKLGAAKQSDRDLERLRELLRVREYLIQVERAWLALPHEERVRLVDHADALGLPATEDSAKGLLSMSITQMALATIVGATSQSVGREASLPDAMAATPITLQLTAIRSAGDHHAAPGQAMKLLGVKKRRGWFR